MLLIKDPYNYSGWNELETHISITTYVGMRGIFLLGLSIISEGSTHGTKMATQVFAAMLHCHRRVEVWVFRNALAFRQGNCG